MEMRGQGAIEYLLIIGAAILVVAVVIIALTSVSSTAGENTNPDAIDDITLELECQKICVENGGSWADKTCTDYTFDVTDETEALCAALE